MFSPRQIELLRALIDSIIPADEDPGGWEAGVGNYLFHQFERDLKHLLPLYVLGLEALDAEAQAVYHLSFDRLPAHQQNELLMRIEVGSMVSTWLIDPIAFFRMAVEHCAEGYYSNPENGGNHGGASWKMIGFEVRG